MKRAKGDERPASLAAGAPGSFERDSLVWALGKLAERSIRHHFRDPTARARYERWFSEEAPRLANATGPEEGLLLFRLELGSDGTLSLRARPQRGQFLLIVEHQQFQAVVALAHGSLHPRRQLEGLCLADFEGDAELALRWTLGLHRWLHRRWQLPLRNQPERTSSLN